jgi:hypothetical protein
VNDSKQNLPILFVSADLPMNGVMKKHILTLAPFLLFLSSCALFPLQGDLDPPDPYAEAMLQQQEAQAMQQYQINMARARRDITLGMTHEDVMNIWGEPRSIDRAGHDSSGNQRWVYYEGLSSPWSLSTMRVVYFEEGRVVGWDKQR